MTTLMIFVFLILLGVVFASVSLGLRVLESQRRRQVKGMVAVVGGTAAEIPQGENLLLSGAKGLVGRPQMWRYMETMMQQAGLEWTLWHLLIATLLSTAAGTFIGWYWRPLGFYWLSMIALAGFGAILPITIVRIKRRNRLAAIEEQLPEALDFLARSMRAGHAFSISLEMLSRELPAPLGQEFRVLFHQLNLGASTESALHNLADRVPIVDVKMFVSSVLLQKQTGGSLSEILVRLAYVIRERFRLRGQVRVASAHGRLTAAVLTLLPVFLVVALLIVAPGYLQALAADEEGRWMILGAIAAQIAGYYIMSRIVNIKV